MIFSIAMILAGFVLLVKGGDWLVDGSVTLAQKARLSSMVIGLTVMGFGTSAPELLVSAQAAWTGSSGIALGNVAGSNIANIALILGVTALMRPVPVGRRTLLIDMPFMLLSMAALVIAAWNGVIERWMGLCMFAALVAFVWWEVVVSRREEKRKLVEQSKRLENSDYSENSDLSEEAVPSDLSTFRAVATVLLSLSALVLGARWLVAGSTDVARQLGDMLGAEPAAMERIIGLTVVALGTSLPELFASVIAARRGETDMAVGNIIGSVTFNILCVVGVSSTIRPIADAWTPFITDYIVMCVLGLLLWVMLRIGFRLTRAEGIVLLCIYALYIVRLAQIN